jgi:hypothetical protein
MLYDKSDLENVRREEFTGPTMMQFGGMALDEKIGSRLCRLPFVLLLTVGLLLSLIHCVGCGPAFTEAGSAVLITNADSSSAPDTPDQQLPCHAGHCLSHVTGHHVTVAAIPADQVVRLLAPGCEQFPATLAGLPLFKPPRV